MSKNNIKSRIMSFIMIFALILGCFSPLINVVQAEDNVSTTVYNAADDFSLDSNPNGVWSYQYRTSLTGAFANMTDKNASGEWLYAGVGAFTVVNKNNNAYIKAPVNSADKQVALTFTAPQAGQITINMENEKLLTENVNHRSYFTLLHNETKLIDQAEITSTGYAFETKTLNVAEGDTIRFVISRVANGTAGMTYLNPIITHTPGEWEDNTSGSYDAADDFSLTNNPNGVWHYRYSASPLYVFNDMTDKGDSDTSWVKMNIGAFTLGNKDSTTYIKATPSSARESVALTFTAPGRGQLKIAMENDKLITENANHKSYFTLLHNDTKLIDKAEITYTGYEFTEKTLHVEKGDEISFVLSRVASGTAGRTFLNPQIMFEATGDIQQEETIKLLSPANNSEVTIVSDSVKEWTDSYDITETKISEYLGKDDIYYSGPLMLSWQAKKAADSYVVTYAMDEAFSDAKSITTSQSFARLYNLYPGTDYYWRVQANYAEGSETSGVYKFSTTDSRRIVYIDGVSNTRDMGGIMTSSGKTIKYDLLYRGAHLSDITALGKTQAVSELGIATELDLRASGEGGAGTSSPIGSEVQYINSKGTQYASIDEYKGLMKNIMKVFADENNYPIYYHCQVGRDRTGTVGVLLLGLLGVDKEQIYMDYELSAFSYTGGTLANPNADDLRTQLDALYEYLDTYGNGSFSENVEAYLLDCGLTADEIMSIRKILLGDAGETPIVKPTYNAVKDFSLTNNPNGVWSYQYRTSLTDDFTNIANKNATGTEWLSDAGALTTGVKNGTTYIKISPLADKKQVALTFTAPYTGKLSIAMDTDKLLTENLNHKSKFTLQHNGTAILNEVEITSTGYNFENLLLDVNAGDEIRFIVNRIGIGTAGATYLNPQIKYEYEGDGYLKFPSGAEITVDRIRTDGFSISWPAAVGGTGEYNYQVYISDKMFGASIPEQSGLNANACTHTFTGLEYRQKYYVAVVASDGNSKTMLRLFDAIEVFPEMLTFNAYDGYTSKTQNVLWNYLYAPIGTLDTTELSWADGKWGDNVVGSVIEKEKDPVSGKNALCVTPGVDTDVVVTFTVPYSGKISVSMENGGIFVPVNGAGDAYDGINFTMKLNSSVKAQFDQISCKQMHPSAVNPNIYTGRVFTNSYEMEVKKGDILYFVVNKNTRLHNDATYINPKVEYLSVDDSQLGLAFGGEAQIWGTDITKSSLTVNWPMAFGGSGKYQYTLYVSDKKITEIPAKSGIDMGNKVSYVMTGLDAYTDYYFAVVVDDGENTKTLFGTSAISTIGNTYVFDSAEDYTTKMQPIDTPWKYYAQSIEKGTLKELVWDDEKAYYGDTTTALLSRVDSDKVTGKPALQVNPSTHYNGVIAFIAPFSGKITVDVSNGGIFAPYNGEAQGNDGINFTLKQGDKTLYSRNAVCYLNNHGNRCFSNGLSLEVKAGEVLYFIINANQKAVTDTTFLSPRVTYTYVNRGSDSYGFWPSATVQVTNVENNSFTINWSSVFNPDDEVTNYKVWISTSPIKTQPTSKPVYSGSVTNAKCSGLKFATKYYVYILATTTSGKSAVLNPNSAVMTKCPIYDAYKQYTVEANAAGVWNYAVRQYDTEAKAYVYQLLELNDDGKSWGNATLSMISATDNDLVTLNPSMALHPGIQNREAALVFTAPYSGTIRIRMNNGGVFAPKNGEQQDNDGISFTIYQGDTEIYKLDKVCYLNNPVDKRVGTEEIVLKVEYGQKLYFVVGANTSNAADSTFFNPEIEYLEVTGGSGKIDKLEGFVIPEKVEDKMFVSNFRNNDLFDTEGIAVIQKNAMLTTELEKKLIAFGGVVLASLGIILCCIVVFIKRRKRYDA